VGDEKFAASVSEAGYELKVHAGEQHKDGPHHPRANLTRMLVMRVLTDHPVCAGAFEIYSDPRDGRHLANTGQIGRQGISGSGFYAAKYDEILAPTGFCDCYHWSQCTHKPGNGVILIKDAHYYGGRAEVDTLRQLGYQVLVVGWHYNTSEEAYDEVELVLAAEGLYRHTWDGDGESGSYLHPLPGSIELGAGKELVRCGAYRATLYEPFNSSSLAASGPTETSKPSLQRGLTYETLINDPDHGERIKQMVARQIDHKATHAANHFARVLAEFCEDPCDGITYAQLLLDRVAEQSRIATEQITLARRADRMAHDARTRDAAYEYAGPGPLGRLIHRLLPHQRADSAWYELTRKTVVEPLTLGTIISIVLITFRQTKMDLLTTLLGWKTRSSGRWLFEVSPCIVGVLFGLRALARS